MTNLFRSALIAAVERHSISVKAVADRAGISYEQLKKIMQRENASTNVDDAVKVAAVFGLTLDEFLDNDLAADRDEVVRLYNQLSEAERDLIRAAARGMRVQDPEEAP